MAANTGGMQPQGGGFPGGGPPGMGQGGLSVVPRGMRTPRYLHLLIRLRRSLLLLVVLLRRVFPDPFCGPLVTLSEFPKYGRKRFGGCAGSFSDFLWMRAGSIPNQLRVF